MVVELVRKMSAGIVLAGLASLGSAAYAGNLSEPVMDAPVVEPVMATTTSNWYAFGALSYSSSNVEYSYFDSTVDVDLDGFGGTLGLGREWSRNGLVFGVEADVTVGNFEQDLFLADPLATPCLEEGCSGSIDWTGTLRGYVGKEMGAYLPYLTGGLALAGAELYADEGACGYGGACHVDETLTGYVIGVGVKRSLNEKFTLRAEYLYSDFGDVSFESETGAVGGDTRADLAFGTLRLGVDYRF